MKHKFIEFVPEKLEEEIIYISVKYSTINHLCVCGCGLEVVTPISPADWQFCYDGETISLFPSIGNWDYPCKSHYWIKKNKIIWASSWSKKEIEEARSYDKYLNKTYSTLEDTRVSGAQKNSIKKIDLIRKIKKMLLNFLDRTRY